MSQLLLGSCSFMGLLLQLLQLDLCHPCLSDETSLSARAVSASSKSTEEGNTPSCFGGLA